MQLRPERARLRLPTSGSTAATYSRGRCASSTHSSCRRSGSEFDPATRADRQRVAGPGRREPRSEPGVAEVYLCREQSAGCQADGHHHSGRAASRHGHPRSRLSRPRARTADTCLGRHRRGTGHSVTLQVLVQRLDQELPLPSYAHPGDAGADLVTTVDAELGPGERAVLPTGIVVALPDGYAAFVHPRSGLAG